MDLLDMFVNCPVCGTNDAVILSHTEHCERIAWDLKKHPYPPQMYSVSCGVCCTCTPASFEQKEAVERWNTRPQFSFTDTQKNKDGAMCCFGAQSWAEHHLAFQAEDTFCPKKNMKTRRYRIECECGRAGPWAETKEEAVEKWNTRRIGDVD